MKKSEIRQMIQEELAKVMQEKSPQMKANKGGQYISDIIKKIGTIDSHAGIDKSNKNYKELISKMKAAIKALQRAKSLLRP